MPPKKKKATVHPIVVGTVSTRSTRRQSIVNIEIPKSSRTRNIGKTQKVDSDRTSPIILNPLHEKKLLNHIHSTFNEVSNLDKKLVSDSKISGSKYEKEMNYVPVTSTDKYANPKNIEKPRLRQNKALLEILDDWSDDESPKFKKEVPVLDSNQDSSSSTEIDQNRYFENLEFGADDINEIIGDNFRSINSKASNVIEVNVLEMTSELKQRKEQKEKVVIDLDKENGRDCEDHKLKLETFHLDSALSEEIVESCILEENEVIIDEQVRSCEDNIIVECVMQQVVPEQNASIISEGNIPNLEDILSPKVIIDQELDMTMEGNMEIVHTNKEETISEETCQSISTNDSNDAEVKSFFTKEIQNNRNLNEENILNLDKSIDSEISIDVVLTASEINTIEPGTRNFEVGIENNYAAIKSSVNLMDEAESSNCDLKMLTNELQVSHSLIELERTLEDDSQEHNNAETEEKTLTQFYSNEKDTLSPQKLLHCEKRCISEDNFANQFGESLENKIADLNLKDTQSFDNDDVINQKVADLHLGNKVEKVDVKIDNRGAIRQKSSIQEIGVSTKTTACQKVVKPCRTRNSEVKYIKDTTCASNRKISKVDRISKEKKPKVKSRAPKEVKSKKKAVAWQGVKKSSAKLIRKDVDKIEKKDKLEADLDDMEIRRRSSRIKSISVSKKKTIGHGLVRSKSEPSLNESNMSANNSSNASSDQRTPSCSLKILNERKTRWGKSVESLSLQLHSTREFENKINCEIENNIEINDKLIPAKDPVVEARLKTFIHLKENLYKTDRMTCKEAKKMTCDCFLTPEEIDANEYGCGDDCLNKLLLIECGNLCQIGDRCTNKRFQKNEFAPVEVFNTEKKGLGLRAAANIPFGEFILEYVGEVLNTEEFDKRAEVYSQDKNIHYYFMALRADAIIDATMKGNISRFINHSCDPNAETQKWTVNGELRIGFFSTRTILAGEEVTFDYRFQRYGKEAQKCFCEATICRGWLGEQPEDDSEEEDDEEEEEEVVLKAIPAVLEIGKLVPVETTTKEVLEDLNPTELIIKNLPLEKNQKLKIEEEKPVVDVTTVITPPTEIKVKRKSQRKKPRIELFEEIDQLIEEIEMLLTTGLKNQAHTLKLCRLMVRSKEPQQRTKLLRVLRRGELPCRRLFLDYHGLRLIHGYMIDVQHLVITNKKYESLRLEILQTLAVLPIPNKTMLQDSKVLPTVEMWATNKDLSSPLDSDSNSPKVEQDHSQESSQNNHQEMKEMKTEKRIEIKKDETIPGRTIEDQEEEISFLANKLLEEWSNLKEVFRIPKKERIEQMKEHEREANKKFMQNGYGNDQDKDKKSDRYRTSISKYKSDREGGRKSMKSEDKPSAEFIRLSKIERRKLFALQHELKEEERRLKQREMWRQHEMNCLMIGTDPRFTAPFDPNRGYQCIWNPQLGQWQNYPLPPNSTLFQPAQTHPPLPNLNIPPPQIPKSLPNFPFNAPITIATSLTATLPSLPTGVMPGAVQLPPQSNVPQMTKIQNIPQTISGTLVPPNIPTHPALSIQTHPVPNMPTHTQIPTTSVVPIIQYKEPPIKEDLLEVKFMGPIPPPVKLPPKWKCANDIYGRPYYYHIKLRKSQWEPPSLLDEFEESSETESSSETSSLSSESSSDNSGSDDEIDDTRLLLEVRKQMEPTPKPVIKSVIPEYIKKEDITALPIHSPDGQHSEVELNDDEILLATTSCLDEESKRPSIDKRLKEQFNLLKDEYPPRKKRRHGLCEEIIISPRTEQDRMQFKEDLKRYKANKEKLKRQKEQILQQTRKQKEIELKKSKEKRPRTSLKLKIKEMPDFNSESAKKIKEIFRANMASTVVSSLNMYRKTDCREGKITNTDDFKHLARKLTHFVMLKEMKHIAKIEDLTCTDNVKVKAREYIRKYMSKFGEVYIKRNDSPDFKD